MKSRISPFSGSHCGNTAPNKPCSCETNASSLTWPAHTLRSKQKQFRKETFLRHVTFYRSEYGAYTKLSSYVAEGKARPVEANHFDDTGGFVIPEVGRLCRNVLIEKNYPHHGALALGPYGRAQSIQTYCIPHVEIHCKQPKGVSQKNSYCS